MLRKAYLLLWLALLFPLAQAAPTVQFNSATYEVNEGDGYVTITVTRVGDGKASVKVVTSKGTAKKGKDFEKTTKKLKWDDGDDSDKTFTVTIFDDSGAEGDETFALKLKKAKGAMLGNPATAEVTIIDDDGSSTEPGALQFSSATYSVDENGGALNVIVSRVGGNDGKASAKVVTSKGTAKKGKDFEKTTKKLKWDDGDDSDKTFTVAIIDDTEVESDETFALKLKKAKGAMLGNPTTTEVTIIDDDGSSTEPGVLQFSSATYSVDENGGALNVTVSRVGGNDGKASAKVVTSNGTAKKGKDFEKTTKKLKWDDGDDSDKTFTVAIIDDTEVESDETFALKLKKAKGAMLGNPTTAEVTIIDSGAN
jgi:hypothetical protein